MGAAVREAMWAREKADRAAAGEPKKQRTVRTSSGRRVPVRDASPLPADLRSCAHWKPSSTRDDPGPAATRRVPRAQQPKTWIEALLSMPWAKGRWSVICVNDDGRRETVRDGLSADAAELLAGKMRDRCPDDVVAEGWNYLPRNH